MTKNTLQYFEDEADYRLLLVSMQVSIIILILRAESPILLKQAQQIVGSPALSGVNGVPLGIGGMLLFM